MGGAGGYSSTGGATGGGQQGTGEQLRQTAGEAVDQVKDQAGQLADQAREQATTRLEDQKDRATGGLGTVADAVRQTGQQLRQQDQGAVAQYVEGAANQIERLAGYLRGRDVTELIDEVEDFARRQPMVFLGGAFALGLLGARFLKSSGRAARQGQYGQSGRPLPSERRGYEYSAGYRAPAYGGAQGATGEYSTTWGQEGYRGYAPRTGRSGYEGTGGEAYGTSPYATPQSSPSAGRTNLGGATGYGGPGAAETTTGMGGTGAAGSAGGAIVGGPPIEDAIVGGPPQDQSSRGVQGTGYEADLGTGGTGRTGGTGGTSGMSGTGGTGGTRGSGDAGA
jgi:hypothetical protein